MTGWQRRGARGVVRGWVCSELAAGQASVAWHGRCVGVVVVHRRGGMRCSS
jgi:hypothetical protein